MSDDLIHLTLSRADAGLLSGLAEDGLTEARKWVDNDGLGPVTRAQVSLAVAHGRRIIDVLDAALNAAPAEGPERAATGETLVRCGRCGVPFPPHPDPARFDHDFCEDCLPEAVKHWGLMHTAPERLAAIGGGGE